MSQSSNQKILCLVTYFLLLLLFVIIIVLIKKLKNMTYWAVYLGQFGFKSALTEARVTNLL